MCLETLLIRLYTNVNAAMSRPLSPSDD
jgi:hypothetical protein